MPFLSGGVKKQFFEISVRQDVKPLVASLSNPEWFNLAT